MGNCHSENKNLTDEELQALQGKFFIDNGYDMGDSYVCAGYLRRHCDQLEVLPLGALVEASKQMYPVRLRVCVSGNGMVVGASYN